MTETEWRAYLRREIERLLEAAGISEAFSDYAKRSAAMPIRFEDESN